MSHFVSIIYIGITIKTKENWSSSFCFFVYIYNKKTSLRSLFFISSHTLADFYSQDSLTLVLLISLTSFVSSILCICIYFSIRCWRS